MPFHMRLLGKDRLALYSFIHSLSTNFGTAIFQPVAVALAEKRFKRVQTQVKAGNVISERAQLEIQDLKTMGNWVIGGFGMGIVQGIVNYNGQNYPAYGFAELIM